MARADLRAIYAAQADRELEKLAVLDAKAKARVSALAQPQEIPRQVAVGFDPKHRTHNTMEFADIFTKGSK